MEQRRTDRATRRIRAGANRLWQAWIDPAELVRWLPPGGMTGQVLALDPQPDGAFHIRLYYPADAAGHGKTAEGVDDVEGRFVHLDPPRAFRLDVTFRSDDPRFAGVMQMDWCFEAGAEDTLVTVSAARCRRASARQTMPRGLPRRWPNLRPIQNPNLKVFPDDLHPHRLQPL